METTTESGEIVPFLPERNTRSLDGESSSPSTRPAPTRIGRYLIVQELGRGGMGVVWTAYDPKLDRKVAIKHLRSASHDATRKARFVREAQALAKLNHPNIVTVHDVDVHDDQLYMAMEHIEGSTLEQWLRGPHGWREILGVFDEAGRGLAAAHAAGITHRDFKPSNVLIADDGRVKVLDFGLAMIVGQEDELDLVSGSSSVLRLEPPPPRAQDSDIMQVIESSPRGRLTKIGRIMGTPAYMAPEQYVLSGTGNIDDKTDQFSFAVSLYEALYRTMPFAGRDPYEVCDQVASGSIREPPRDSPVPARVFRVLRRALHVDPPERYGSMNELLTELAADPERRRRRLLLYVGGGLVLTTAAFAASRALTAPIPSPPPVCQGSAERMGEIWGPEARASVREGLLATERPFAADTARRVEHGLDAYAEAWQQQHRSICEATRIHGEQSEALLDVRMTCLERRRGELSALIGVLGSTEEDTVAAAVRAVEGLRQPSACATAQPGIQSDLPSEPARRTSFLSLQARLDAANALLAAGRYADARDRAATTSTSARVQGFDRILGEALIAEGLARRQLGQVDEAQQRLSEGITTASSIGDAATEFKGWLELLYIAGVTLGDPSRAEAWQLAAEGALRRNGSAQDLELPLVLTLSAASSGLQRLDDAARHGERARLLATELDEPLLEARALNNLGVIAAKQDHWSLAERMLRRSHELKAEVLGPDHPDVVGNSLNLANVLVQLAQSTPDGAAAQTALDEAERLYTSLAAFRVQRDGPRSESVARVLSMQGRLQRHRGQTTEARRTYERALEILEGHPSSSRARLSVLLNLAPLEREAARLDRARLHYEQAIALKLERHGEGHPSVATTRLELCGVLREAGELEDAVFQCTRVVEALEGADDEQSRAELADARDLLRALGPRTP